MRIHHGVKPMVVNNIVDMAIGVVVQPAGGDATKDGVGVTPVGLGAGRCGSGHIRWEVAPSQTLKAYAHTECRERLWPLPVL